jgi:hypothetical protein
VLVLTTLRPGDVVVLDNLTMHKRPEIQAAIERAGARRSVFSRRALLR